MNRKHVITLYLLIACCIIITAHVAFAETATIFVIPKPNSQPINPARDHVSIKLLKGLTYLDSPAFESARSTNDKLLICVNSTITNFDGTTIGKTSKIVENSDLGKDINRYWGLNAYLIEKSPADEVKFNYDMRVTTYRSDRFSKIIDTISGVAPPIVGIGTESVTLYANLTKTMLDSIFGPVRNAYPFEYQGEIKISQNDINRECYIVLISKNGPSDDILNNIRTHQLSWDGQNLLLVNNGTSSPITMHNYVVLEVMRENHYEISSMDTSSSPWAFFANNTFISADQPYPSSKETLIGYIETRLKDMVKAKELLMQEKRFSSYDINLALRTYAIYTRDHASAVCSDNMISPCPSVRLDRYIAHLDDKLPSGIRAAVVEESVETTRKLRASLDERSRAIKMQNLIKVMDIE